ncbi:MAG: 3-oxoacyl-[acyl-carrier-protein] synthase III C-terminal domain-containing protein [Aureliella sp.]
MNQTESESHNDLRIHQAAQRIGIAAIETTAPVTRLPNAWFGDRFPRKFEKHTGIRERGVFHEDEVTVSARTVESLMRRTACDWSDCAGLILASPALVPADCAHRFWDHSRAKQEQPNRVAGRLWDCLNATKSHSRGQDKSSSESTRPFIGINGFCSGYAQAMQLVLERFTESRPLGPNQYYIVVTATCISRINDYSNPQSGGLFGDFATATMLRRMDCGKLQPRFELCDAQYERKEVSRSFFDFEQVAHGMQPTPDGEPSSVEQKVVFKLDGMGIADTAPRAMASAAESICKLNYVEPADVDWVVPHQAGSGIVRLTGMKLEQSGFRVDPINGLTGNCGNVSSGSVPMALAENWDKLRGIIACPVAAVGAPGKPEVSQGCILLRGPRPANSIPAEPSRAAG